MRKITENIFTETHFHGCNPSFVVTKEGIILIDTPFLPTDALRWKNTLEESGTVKYIINTEHHVDHVLGNFFFSAAVISHRGTKEKFGPKSEKMEEVLRNICGFDPDAMHLLKEYTPNEPRITFDHSLTLICGKSSAGVITSTGAYSQSDRSDSAKRKSHFYGGQCCF